MKNRLFATLLMVGAFVLSAVNASAFVYTWNENTPAETESYKLGGSRIRELKHAIRERIAVDHVLTDFASGETMGYHKAIHLVDEVNPDTTAVGAVIFSKLVSSDHIPHFRQGASSAVSMWPLFYIFNGSVQQDTRIAPYGNDFIFGSPTKNYYSTSTKTRMFFDVTTGAFRAGFWDSTNFDTRGSYSVATGYKTKAEGTYSFAHGNGANASLYGQVAHSNDVYSTSANTTQYSTLHFYLATIGTGAEEMFLNGSSQRAILKEKTVWTFSALITGVDVVGADKGNCAGYELKGVIRRDASNNTTIVGSVAKTVVAEDVSGWDVNITADDTNESLKISVSGEQFVVWSAKVDLVEVRW